MNLEDGTRMYAGVSGTDRIEMYTLNFPPGTGLVEAQLRVRAELPSDAREVRARVLRQCRIAQYRSDTLERLFRNAPHRGRINVGFFSRNDQRFDTRAVSFVHITLVQIDGDVPC